MFGKIVSSAKRHHLILLLIFSFLLFYFQIWTKNIFFTDELIIEEASYVMGKGGDLMLPMLNGLPYLTKPPLIYWQTAPLYNLFPASTYLVRFWMPIYGLGLVLGTYLLGKRWYGSKVGFISALLLATSTPLVLYTKSANYDIPNAFFTVMTIYFYNLAKDNIRFLILAAVSLLLGLYVRSWLALIPCGVVLLDQILIVKKRIPLLYMISFFVFPIALFGIWYWFAYLSAPKIFIEESFSLPFIQHFAGIVPGDIKSTIPFPLLVLICFPAVIFLVCYKYFYAFRGNKSAVLQLAVWIIGLGGLLSVSQTQHDWYLMALYPSLAIASGVVITKILEKSKKDSLFRFLALVGFISVIATAPVGLLTTGVPGSEIISYINFIKDNNGGQPIFYWSYLLNPVTRFYPGRQVIIVDKNSFREYLDEGELKFLIARTSDVPEITALKKPKKITSTPQMAMLEFN